ncbi:MAG: hypothetical protein ACKVW3_04215 [Phycisphaerales bacterium]
MTNSDQVRAIAAVADARCPCCRSALRGVRGEECPACGTVIEAARLRVRRCRAAPAEPPLTGLLLVNLVLSLAVLSLAASQGGRLPAIAWASPAVLGAMSMSARYWYVFLTRWPADIDLGRGALLLVATMQVVGLVGLLA